MVAKHTEASYTKCGALLVRSLEVWCVTSRAGHSRAFQRINGENVVDIQVFGFISPIFLFLFHCLGLSYMPKLGKQTATHQTSARSFTVFATVIGK